MRPLNIREQNLLRKQVRIVNRRQLMARIDARWKELVRSNEGLSEEHMALPGVVGDWSVKDLIAHVTTWEEEALKMLPLIARGLRTPLYGGIDRFNAKSVARKRSLSHDQVSRESAETHQRLISYLEEVPESLFATETRFRRRLRLDTYGHYPEHTRSIEVWRAQRNV
jgi:hypothetical protein